MIDNYDYGRAGVKEPAAETLEEKIARVMRGISSITTPSPTPYSLSSRLPETVSTAAAIPTIPTTNLQLQEATSSSSIPAEQISNFVIPSLEIPATTTAAMDLPTPIDGDDTVAPVEAVYLTPSNTLKSEVQNAEKAGWSLKSLTNENHIRARVTLRIRPYIGKELRLMNQRNVTVHGNCITLTNPNAFSADPDSIAEIAQATNMTGWASEFQYDNIFWSCSRDDPTHEYINQSELYNQLGLQLVENAFTGISSTCIAFGHSGSGKSYTLFGPDFTEPTSSPQNLSEVSGLVPRAIVEVIGALNRSNKYSDTNVSLSILEIYNERIKDLLCSTHEHDNLVLKIREHPTDGPYVENLTKVPVITPEDGLHHLSQALCSNKRSNPLRSHLVVTLELTCKSIETNEHLRSVANSARKKLRKELIKTSDNSKIRLTFVDLAGSERETCLDGSHEASAPGIQGRRNSKTDLSLSEKTELRMIRSSLSSLGFIIKNVSKVGSSKTTLPFRDSVLTHLLKESLTERCFISCIATLSPSVKHYSESINTLKFMEDIYSAIRKASKEKEDTKQHMSEYDRIQTSLGANEPGSAASKLFLKATVSDPQQRLAKLRGTHDSEDRVDRSKAIADQSSLSADFRAYNDLKNAYRSLQSQFVELQIELDTARTDRDSYLNELKAAKDTVSYLELGAISQKKMGSNDSDAESIKEVNELRDVVSRKEEMIEKLLVDLTDSKKNCERFSKMLESQRAETAQKIEKITGELAGVSTELKQVKRAEVAAVQAKEQMILEKRNIQTMLDEANLRVRNLEEDLAKSNSFRNSLQKEISTLKYAYNSAEGSLREKTNDNEKLKLELESVVGERDTLLLVIENQKESLSIQSLRSEDSMKSLWSRQETLDRVGKDAAYSLNQLMSVQEGLQGLLAREGIVMHSELLDLKRLLSLLSSVRERLLEINDIRTELENEKHMRVKLEENTRDGVASISIANAEEQLSKYRKACETNEARANYWQSVAQKVQSASNSIQDTDEYASLLQENAELKNQLAVTLAELSVSNAALQESQENMHREFSSLWLAVQELNKLDAVKEKAICDLISDRDRVTLERDSGMRKFSELSVKYNALQKDLEAVDRDLLAAAEVEQLVLGNGFQVGDSYNYSALPAQRSKDITSQDQPPPYIEKVVQNQINELSGFLTADRNRSIRRSKLYNR